MLSPEDLLQKRYKVIAPWPCCPYSVGDLVIISSNKTLFMSNETGDQSVWEPIEHISAYPTLITGLPWYADRKPEDMPEYVKDEEGCCYKVQEWHTDLAPKATVFIDTKIHKGYIDGCYECPIYCDLFPATEADYLTYKNKNNG